MADWQPVTLGVFLGLVIGAIVITFLYFFYFTKEEFKNCPPLKATTACPLGGIKWFKYPNSFPQLAASNFFEKTIDSDTNTVAKAQAWVLKALTITSASTEWCSSAFLVYPQQNPSGTLYYGSYPALPAPSPSQAQQLGSSTMTASELTEVPWYKFDTYVFSALDNVVPLSVQPT